MDNLAFTIIVYVFVFLFGVSIGSFLNVCIYRLPIGESLTKQNSHCMTCGAYIKRKDLIPIVSWCMLRGKCRACGAKISPRYTIVEALNGILFLLVFWYYKPIENLTYANGMQLLVIAASTAIAFSALVVIFFMDLDTQLINDGVVAIIAIMAIPKIIAEQSLMKLDLSDIHYNFPSIKMHIIGIFAASVILLIIALVSHEKAMGYGDVTLMAASGLFLGTKAIAAALFFGFISAAIIGLIIKRVKGESKVAFGPYLAASVAFCTFFGDKIVDWYINAFHIKEIFTQAEALLII